MVVGLLSTGSLNKGIKEVGIVDHLYRFRKRETTLQNIWMLRQVK